MPERTRRSGWILPAILLGVYLLIKVQGWAFAYEAGILQRQLDELRPALSAMALAEQLKIALKAYEEGIRQIRRQHLPGPILLKDLTHLPASMVLERVELSPRTLRIRGTFLAGIRPPEKVLVPWAERLRSLGPALRIRKIAPSPEEPGRWQFELQVEDVGA